jgi:hypothetical protein
MVDSTDTGVRIGGEVDPSEMAGKCYERADELRESVHRSPSEGTTNARVLMGVSFISKSTQLIGRRQQRTVMLLAPERTEGYIQTLIRFRYGSAHLVSM